MRRDALPGLIRAARARPLRRQIARLEIEEAEIAEQTREIQEGVPELTQTELARGITPAMKRNHVLSSLAEERSALVKKLRQNRAELDGIAAEGPVPMG